MKHHVTARFFGQGADLPGELNIYCTAIDAQVTAYDAATIGTSSRREDREIANLRFIWLGRRDCAI